MVHSGWGQRESIFVYSQETPTNPWEWIKINKVDQKKKKKKKKRNRYTVVMSYGWFTQSSVWFNSCTWICLPYGLTRLCLFHYSNIIWAPSHLISLATWLFGHVLLLLDNKGHPKAPFTVHFLGVSTGRAGVAAGVAESVSVSWRHYKNIEIHTVHTILSWPNPKQWQMVHTSDLIMVIDRARVFSQSSHER